MKRLIKVWACKIFGHRHTRLIAGGVICMRCGFYWRPGSPYQVAYLPVRKRNLEALVH